MRSAFVTRIGVVFITFGIGLVLLKYLETMTEQYSLPFGLVLITVLSILWIFCGGKYWWFAFPIVALWGGIFWVGFKMYSDEIGIIAAGGALAVALVKNYPAMLKNRTPISWAFSLLIIYFIAHMSVSLFVAKADWLSGGGSIVRVYASGMTYLLFSWMYYKFGSSNHIKAVMIIIFIVMLARIIVSMLNLYPAALPEFSGTDYLWLYPSADLRFSALYQMLFGIVLFYHLQARWAKTSMMAFIIAMFILVMFGEGRVSVAMAASTFLFWILLARRMKLLIFVLPLLFVSVSLLYGDIHVLSQLPGEMARAISFIPGLESQLLYNVEASNNWHFDLMYLGFQRWSSSFTSLVFGNVIDPAGVYLFLKLDYFSQMIVAASTGRYESSLWTILGTLGIVGMICYIWIFAFLFREIVPVVIKEGVRSVNHAVYAIAIISLLLMILFGWIRGGFPGIELLLGVMAKAVYEDNKRKDLSSARI
jgi:hypothetical protein